MNKRIRKKKENEFKISKIIWVGKLKIGSLIIDDDQCDVYIYSNEHFPAHFHIIGKNWESCIELYNPNYIDHGIDRKIFTTKELSILNNWMKEPNWADSRFTNWECMNINWSNGENNCLYNIPENPIQPDYTKLS